MNASLREQIALAKEAFKQFESDVNDELDKALVRCALRVERSYVEKWRGRDDESIPGEPPRVQTGRARASRAHRLYHTDEERYIEIGIVNNDYMIDVELGTSTTYPHPILKPSLEENSVDNQADIAEAIVIAAKKADKY